MIAMESAFLKHKFVYNYILKNYSLKVSFIDETFLLKIFNSKVKPLQPENPFNILSKLMIKKRQNEILSNTHSV